MCDNKMNKKQKLVIARLTIGAVLLVCALFAGYNFDLSPVQLIAVMSIPYFVISYDIIADAIGNLLRGQVLDEKFLMTVATVGALILGEFAEAFAVMLLYRIGEMLSDMAVKKSRRSIAELMDIKPDFATVLRGGKEMTVEPEEVQVGETITVKPGQRIPLDGVIEKGSTAVDCSSLTGESLPIECTVGDKVISGSINNVGVIEVKVSSNYSDSTVSEILELLENSADRKAKTESFVSKFAKYYTPAIVILGVLVAIIPSAITGEWAKWIGRALLLLVISCPCALVISVPLAYFCSIGAASSNGILVKGANYLELLSDVDIMLFDKTGTLTKGEFTVTEINAVGVDENELLKIAALSESDSNHPIGRAIVSAYSGELDKSLIGNVKEISGKGISLTADGDEILCGNARLMQSSGIEYDSCNSVGSVVYLARNSVFIGSIVVCDTVKENSKDALNVLRKTGVRSCVMLTGDNERIAERIAEEVGVDKHYSDLLPADKVKITKNYLSRGSDTKVAFVGDGINDAPVLSVADVGIAMGALGSDAAIEAADIVLMKDDLGDLVKAIKISHSTKSKVKSNIIFAIAVKTVVMLLGIFGFAGMWLAVFADVGVSVIAVINSALLLIKYKNKSV